MGHLHLLRLKHPQEPQPLTFRQWLMIVQRIAEQVAQVHDATLKQEGRYC